MRTSLRTCVSVCTALSVHGRRSPPPRRIVTVAQQLRVVYQGVVAGGIGVSWRFRWCLWAVAIVVVDILSRSIVSWFFAKKPRRDWDHRDSSSPPPSINRQRAAAGGWAAKRTMEASRVTDRFLLQPPSLPSLNFSPKQRHASATASSSLSPLLACIIAGSVFSVVASVTLLLFLRRGSVVVAAGCINYLLICFSCGGPVSILKCCCRPFQGDTCCLQQ